MLPIVSQFYRIIISMFFNVSDRYHLPHLHVQCAEYRCTFDFNGNIPNRQRKLVEVWIEIRKEDLIALWSVIQNGTNGFTIEPLK